MILCIGESAQTREAKQACAFIKKQLDDDLKGIYENELDSVIIAYEPIWAIGTGKVPTNRDITKMIDSIRKEIEYLYSEKAGKNTKIVYGGSVNMNNFKKILENQTVNGVLVGGACLDVDTFAVMCRENF